MPVNFPHCNTSFLHSQPAGHAVSSDGACARSIALPNPKRARANTRLSRLLFAADSTSRRPLLVRAHAIHSVSSRANANLCVHVAHAVNARARPVSDSTARALVAAHTAHASDRARCTVHIATHSIRTRIIRARRRGLPAKISAAASRCILADSASEYNLRS